MAPHELFHRSVPQGPVPQATGLQLCLGLSVLHVVSASAFLPECPRPARFLFTPQFQINNVLETTQESPGPSGGHGGACLTQ